MHKLENAPAVEVAPVVHGHWIDRCGDFECSQCRSIFDYEVLWHYMHSHYNPHEEHFAYCPRCGAKMDEAPKPKEAT